MEGPEPHRDCPLCPRLVDFRETQRKAHADWFNGPVPSFAGADEKLLIVGLAPGLQGANRTGRPFTGDYAGDLLYATLLKFGFAKGSYRADPHDGLRLAGTMITNAVRCVPPQNKPLPAEIRTCNSFLVRRIEALPRVQAIVALGRIAHDATLMALKKRPAHFSFKHGARHDIDGLALFDSYHCSRYNTNTGVLTTEMFETLFADVRRYIDASSARVSSASRAGSGTG